jgi:FMN-dependent NADH-azoreductase
MSHLLYLNASPRGDRSNSKAVADAFVDAYRTSHPGDTVETIHLFETELPPFDGPALQAKYSILGGGNPTPDEQKGWDAVEAAIERFKAADVYVFAIPMWNFSIPYKLKHYIDVIVQPGYTFSFSPEEGYRGLLTGKRAFVAFARGGGYPAGTEAAAFDFQAPYVRNFLGFIGIVDVEEVIVEPTLGSDPAASKAIREDGALKARALAEGF